MPTTFQISLQNGAIKGSFEITNQLMFGDRDVIYYDGETSLNDAWAGHLGNAHKTLAVQANSKAADTQGAFIETKDVPDPDANHSTFIASVVGGGARVTDGAGMTTEGLPAAGFSSPPAAGPTVLGGAETSYAPAQLTDSIFDSNDTILGVKPRDRWKYRTRREFYDTTNAVGAGPGRAQTHSGTTTSGSADLVIPDVSTLLVGQQVSGTGIPSDTIIVAIKRATKVTDSATPSSLQSGTVVMSQKATASATVQVAFGGTAGAFVCDCWLDELDTVTKGTLSLLQ